MGNEQIKKGTAGQAQAPAGEKVPEHLFVTKEPQRGNDGKMYNNYKIVGTVRGRSKFVELVPPKFGRETDGGGYGVFEDVFGAEKTAIFVKEVEEFTDAGGKKQKRDVFSLYNIDKDTGLKYEAPCIPKRPSDRAVLDMMLMEHTAKLAAQKVIEDEKIIAEKSSDGNTAANT